MTRRHTSRMQLELRLELLRMRGAIERDETAAAAARLRRGAARFGAVATIVGSIGRVLAGSGGWARGLASELGARPALITLGFLALRALRRRPIVVLAVAGGAVAYLALRRDGRDGRVRPASDADLDHD